MATTKQTLNSISKILGLDNEKEISLLSEGISSEDNEKLNHYPEIVGEIIEILSKLPKETKILYSYAYLDIALVDGEVQFIVGS